MESIIITKWIEPYKLLETIKKDYDYKDFTFDGFSKPLEKTKFFDSLKNDKKAIGLYMKNVNKYYIFFNPRCENIWENLSNIFNFTDNDFETTNDIEKPLNMVDLGKAEAALFFSNN